MSNAEVMPVTNLARHPDKCGSGGSGAIRVIRPVEFRFDRRRDSPIANSETGNWLLTGWTINPTRSRFQNTVVCARKRPSVARMPSVGADKKTDVASDKKVRDARRAPARLVRRVR
jgi:hypothetical protein